MMYFTVYCEDRQTNDKVVLLDLATRQEAANIVSFMKKYCNSCDIYYVRFDLVEGEH